MKIVKKETYFKISTGSALLAILLSAVPSRTQESLAPIPPSQPVISQEQAVMNPSAPCVEPPPMVRLRDYNGPLKKTVGLFTQQIERRSVHPPHFKPGAVLCSLEVKDKFLLFVRSTYDPIIFLSAGFSAGLSQAQNEDPTFGQGGAGYAKRFAASYTDEVSFRFFKNFAYPTIFREDPRYYRLGHGTGRQRLLHAMEHAVVAHRDNGNRMFNFSEWLGTLSAISLSNMYYPGNERGFAPTTEGLAISIGSDMGFDIVREFWPEISHKFKLPFRDEPAQPSPDSTITPNAPPGR
jgi:hypothetical protein